MRESRVTNSESVDLGPRFRGDPGSYVLRAEPSAVIAGLDPAIHDELQRGYEWRRGNR